MPSRLARLALVCACCLLAACQRLAPPDKSGELVVGICRGAPSYLEENGVKSGFEYDLVEAFVASLKLKTRYVIASDQGELRRLLTRNLVHFAASAQTHSPS